MSDAELQPILDALSAKDWYVAVAGLLMVAVKLWRGTPYAQKAWAWFPDGWRWVPVYLAAVVVLVGQAAIAGTPLVPALVQSFVGGWYVALGAMGGNALLTEAPVRWNGDAGGKPTDPPP